MERERKGEVSIFGEMLVWEMIVFFSLVCSQEISAEFLKIPKGSLQKFQIWRSDLESNILASKWVILFNLVCISLFLKHQRVWEQIPRKKSVCMLAHTNLIWGIWNQQEHVRNLQRDHPFDPCRCDRWFEEIWILAKSEGLESKDQRYRLCSSLYEK